MKKILSIFLSLSLLLISSGCSLLPAESSSSTPEPSPVVTATPEPTATPVPTASPTPTPEPTATPEPINTIRGTVESCKTDLISIVDDNGNSYSFVIDENTARPDESIESGFAVTLSYIGSLDDIGNIKLNEISINLTEEDTRINELISSMSMEEKVGQMFIVRCPGSDKGAADVSTYMPGGYILFARDFSSYNKDEVVSNIASYQNASSIPMFIGVDEEGGTVTRVSRYKQFADENYYSPRDLYASGGLDAVIAIEQDKINLLKSLGINMNFAPVCDISTNPDDFIYKRSLGESAEITSEFAARTVELYDQNGMACTLKHFPGYGNNADTHTGIAYDQRSWDELESKEILPFETGSQAGRCAILVSHNIIESVDSNEPASLSPVIHDYIRNSMGFDGVIMTDDLGMDAIKDYCESDSAAVDAVLAGNDLLCCTNYTVQIPAVIQAVSDGTISEERINESVARILKYKLEIGIIS